jgi:hypothetical protein
MKVVPTKIKQNQYEVCLSCARQTPDNQTTGSEEDSGIEVDCLTNIVVLNYMIDIEEHQQATRSDISVRGQLPTIKRLEHHWIR